jgi:hypothetical protein
LALLLTATGDRRDLGSILPSSSATAVRRPSSSSSLAARVQPAEGCTDARTVTVADRPEDLPEPVSIGAGLFVEGVSDILPAPTYDEE